MSYPPELFHSDEGEVSAWARHDDAPADLTYANGGAVDYLATSAATGGLFGLYRWHFFGPISGPDPHFHKTISESFYVLTGTVRFYDGRGWVDGHPGDFLHVPPGGLHGFRNESGLPASMLLHFAPGAPREPYFETLKALGEGLEMTAEEHEAFMFAHDTYWV
jgi:mannose-6-phosphate isomerase-like protein (cupin superfamily)